MVEERKFPNIRPLLKANLVESLAADMADRSPEEIERLAEELLTFAEEKGREFHAARQS